MYGNYNGVPTKSVTPYEGIREKLGQDAEVIYAQGCSYHEEYIEKEIIPSEYLSVGELTGLKAEYYSNPDLAGEPVKVKQDSTVGFFLFERSPMKGMPAEDYSIRWTGNLEAPTTGSYTLYLTANDGLRFWLDGELVIDEWKEGQHKKTLNYEFIAGSKHAIKIEYFQHDWSSTMFLEWGIPTAGRHEKAIEAAHKADAIVFVGGLSPWLEGEEMDVDLSGFNGGDRTDLALPGIQLKLLKELVKLGKPVVLILMNGSALAVNWADKHVPAILEAWYPGQSGGTAIADILFGDYNPAGRLPVTFYRSADQLPSFDDYAMEGRTYRFFKGDALYPFGYGLSYTDFSYSKLEMPNELVAGEDLKLEVKIKNTGDMDGDEVVQVYVRHLDSGKIIPLHALKGFKRIHLMAGESKNLSFTLYNKDLCLITEHYERVVIPGKLEIFVGGQQPSDKALKTGKVLKGEVLITGDKAVIDSLPMLQ
jgi:beta-glucosidase